MMKFYEIYVVILAWSGLLYGLYIIGLNWYIFAVSLIRRRPFQSPVPFVGALMVASALTMPYFSKSAIYI